MRYLKVLFRHSIPALTLTMALLLVLLFALVHGPGGQKAAKTVDLASLEINTTHNPAQTDNRGLNCTENEVCFYNRALRADNGQTRFVSYFFRYRAPKPGQPTVVYIPGGPGDTSTNMDINHVRGIPEGYGVILTDARFTGLNKRPDAGQFRRSMNSEGVADDIIGALRATHTKNPLVYGVSYGTVPATILSSKLKQSPELKPAAVVLDSTFSHGVLRETYQNGFRNEWKRVKAEAGPEAVAAFNRLSRILIDTKKVSAEDLGLFIRFGLMARMHEPGKNVLLAILSQASEHPRAAMLAILNYLKQIKVDQDDASDGLFEGYIMCHELMPDINVEDKIEYNVASGELKFPNVSDCNRFPGPLSVLYDSRKWQIESPLIYLQGERDPATPVDGTLSHLTTQKLADKRIVIVPDGGHSVLKKELNECSPNFWRALAAHPSTAINALDACTRRPGALISGSDEEPILTIDPSSSGQTTDQ